MYLGDKQKLFKFTWWDELCPIKGQCPLREGYCQQQYNLSDWMQSAIADCRTWSWILLDLSELLIPGVCSVESSPFSRFSGLLSGSLRPFPLEYALLVTTATWSSVWFWNWHRERCVTPKTYTFSLYNANLGYIHIIHNSMFVWCGHRHTVEAQLAAHCTLKISSYVVE